MDQHCHRVAESFTDRMSSLPSFPCHRELTPSLYQIWIHVPSDRTDKNTGEKKPILQVVLEKKSMINLVRHRSCPPYLY